MAGAGGPAARPRSRHTDAEDVVREERSAARRAGLPLLPHAVERLGSARLRRLGERARPREGGTTTSSWSRSDPNTLEVLGQPLKVHLGADAGPLSGRPRRAAAARPDVRRSAVPRPPLRPRASVPTPSGTSATERHRPRPRRRTASTPMRRRGSFAVAARAKERARSCAARVDRAPRAAAARAARRAAPGAPDPRLVSTSRSPAAPGGVKARLASGRPVAATALGADGRSLAVKPRRRPHGPATASTSKVIVDRAQRPKRAGSGRSTRFRRRAGRPTARNLVLLWAAGGPAQPGPRSGAGRRPYLQRGAARTGAPEPRPRPCCWWATAPSRPEEAAGRSLVELVKKSNEITLGG